MSRKRWILESPSNTTFKHLKTLLTSKGIKSEGECLLSGSKLVLEKAKSAFGVKALIFAQGFDFHSHEGVALLHALAAQKGEWVEIAVSGTLFRELDELGTHQPILWIEIPKLAAFDPVGATPKGLELLCPFGDPQNLGAVARSARAFGVGHLILTSEAANPYLPKSLKASAGALLDLKISKCALNLAQTLNALSQQPLYGLDLTGQDMMTWTAPKNLYLALGEEGQGLPAEKALIPICIPISGVESLNAAVASSLAIFYLQQR